MDDRLACEVASIANDHWAGASALLRRALAVLRRAAISDPASLERLSPLVCRAQPSMGAIWNAVCAALGADHPVKALDRFERATDRAERVVTRVALTALSGADGPSRVTTCSASGTVSGVLEAISARRPLRVACAEGRPVYEGRTMAAALAATGIPVELYTDAGVGAALGSSDALLIGADAVSGDWVINKTGSAQLAALAAEMGVPVYVVATGDKLIPPEVASLLWLREGPADQVWDQFPSRRDGPESLFRTGAAHAGPGGAFRTRRAGRRSGAAVLSRRRSTGGDCPPGASARIVLAGRVLSVAPRKVAGEMTVSSWHRLTCLKYMSVS